MKLMDKLAGASRLAWKHKNLVLRGVELNPVASLVIRHLDSSAESQDRQETRQATADILAYLIEEDHKLGAPRSQSAVTVLDPVIEQIRQHTGLSAKQMQSVLRDLSFMQGQRQ